MNVNQISIKTQEHLKKYRKSFDFFFIDFEGNCVYIHSLMLFPSKKVLFFYRNQHRSYISTVLNNFFYRLLTIADLLGNLEINYAFLAFLREFLIPMTMHLWGLLSLLIELIHSPLNKMEINAIEIGSLFMYLN